VSQFNPTVISATFLAAIISNRMALAVTFHSKIAGIGTVCNQVVSNGLRSAFGQALVVICITLAIGMYGNFDFNICIALQNLNWTTQL
jgi:hypothetical protein